VLDISNNVSPIRFNLILYVFFEFLSNLSILLNRIFRLLYPFILAAPDIIQSAHHYILLLIHQCTHILYLQLQPCEILRELIHNLFLQLKDQVITVCGVCVRCRGIRRVVDICGLKEISHELDVFLVF
jgi:hypothetical protein